MSFNDQPDLSADAMRMLGIPTDEELDDAIKRSGFTHCFDVPYRWVEGKASMPRGLVKYHPPTVKPTMRRWAKKTKPG